MTTATKKAIIDRFSSFKSEYSACVELINRCVQSGALR